MTERADRPISCWRSCRDAGRAAAAGLHRRRAWRRQDLRHARGRARPARERRRRRGRLRRDLRPRRHRARMVRISKSSRAGKVPYQGVVLEEMDLDAILARKPQLCLVDELAHTNAPGSRHEKRYQDVLELLDHGISVHDRGQHPASRDAERRRQPGHRRARARDGARHVPRSRRRGRQRRRRPSRSCARGCGRARSTSRRRSSRRWRTSSARATCRRCASWRCARSPMRSARRRRRAGSAKAWSRR